MTTTLIMIARADDTVPLRDSIDALRGGGFNGRLIVFGQPGVDLQDCERRMSEYLQPATQLQPCELWRNIVRWWRMKEPNSHALLLVYAGLAYHKQAAESLQLLFESTPQAGFASLFAPQKQQQHFSIAIDGWNALTLPAQPLACCLSAHAADVLNADKTFQDLDPATQDWEVVVQIALRKANLLQAIHYPSHVSSLNGLGEVGLLFDPDKVLRYGSPSRA